MQTPVAGSCFYKPAGKNGSFTWNQSQLLQTILPTTVRYCTLQTILPTTVRYCTLQTIPPTTVRYCTLQTIPPTTVRYCTLQTILPTTAYLLSSHGDNCYTSTTKAYKDRKSCHYAAWGAETAMVMGIE